ncbi:putative monooxygenase p33MONOX [Salmo trutta]|uniref:Putative monooxygenase p33MONOX n=1 Tax=Salmo trutta TaxID=8032 RepID=A0A674DST1_SALTR|nr:putative monooxygenase p33MONOX [Salmo trutta]XP_029557463.1 putative monooxygenase p33MONOX [Salmo trutta]XP_029557464.1 putative monooxygenase p33MONOX [Salmo trutta]
MSRSGDIPALESGTPEGLLGGMSLPIGMTRRAMSYDDNMEAPMSPPPSDININNLWGRRPVVPDRRFSHLAEEDESGNALTHAAMFDAGLRPHMPVVVKAKASSIILNSLMTKQTQDSMYRFEQQAGLRDTVYTPHKGLTSEETRHHHRMPESFHKMNIQSMDMGAGHKGGHEDKQTSSAQSTPNSTPQSSPKQKRRGWFTSQSSTVTSSDLSTSSNTSVDMGAGEGGGAVERWGVFGPRLVVQKSITDTGADHTNTGGFALQSYRGAQKPTPMELMKAQATRLADDPAVDKQAPPKMEIPTMEGSRRSARPHKLKPRDMNILTPSGF